MGKRKASVRSKMEPKKKVQKLATSFACPFCNHADSVDCTIDLKLRIAEVACRVCEESYSTKAHELTEPIDVYSEWIDECEKVNEPLSDGDDDQHDSSHTTTISSDSSVRL